MVAAMACFVINDAMVKYVSQSLPAAQLIFLRGLMASALVLVLAHALGATARLVEAIRTPAVLLRAVVDAIATLLYLSALFHMPIGNATAIIMTSPLVIAALAIPLFGERVPATRWWAIAVGFAGVVLVIQPQSDSFTAWSLVALSATFFHASRDLLMRRIGVAVPAILVALTTAVTVTLFAGALSIVQGWEPVRAGSFGLLAMASVALSSGYLLLILATQSGQLSAIAPFQYSALIWAIVLGWLVWGDLPNPLAWSGIVMLTAAGLYMLRR